MQGCERLHGSHLNEGGDRDSRSTRKVSMLTWGNCSGSSRPWRQSCGRCTQGTSSHLHNHHSSLKILESSMPSVHPHSSCRNQCSTPNIPESVNCADVSAVIVSGFDDKHLRRACQAGSGFTWLHGRRLAAGRPIPEVVPRRKAVLPEGRHRASAGRPTPKSFLQWHVCNTNAACM
jgi:hypothetical protein